MIGLNPGPLLVLPGACLAVAIWEAAVLLWRKRG